MSDETAINPSPVIPPLIVSLGDPSGIGPEIIALAWKTLKESGPEFVVLGDADCLSTYAPVCRIKTLEEAKDIFSQSLPVLDRPLYRQPENPGDIDASMALSIQDWIAEAVDLCLNHKALALVTCPIHKASLYRAGFSFPGHTEYLEKLTQETFQTSPKVDGPRGPVMMLAVPDLRVVLASVHIPLKDVVSSLTRERIVHVGEVTAFALRRDFGIASPRLALAGLNPHAGEDGTIGNEEMTILNPAVHDLNRMDIDCQPARPADTLFHEGARKTYDAVIGLYHDQVLIPIKTLDFFGGVNITLGLPIVRTSPDHGVAYDLVGKSLARPDSLISALKTARAMAEQRKLYLEISKIP